MILIYLICPNETITSIGFIELNKSMYVICKVHLNIGYTLVASFVAPSLVHRSVTHWSLA